MDKMTLKELVIIKTLLQNKINRMTYIYDGKVKGSTRYKLVKKQKIADEVEEVKELRSKVKKLIRDKTKVYKYNSIK